MINLKDDINIDHKTVSGFGDEWSRFKQDRLNDETRKQMFSDYFGLVDWDALPAHPVAADLGCGSGRWALLVAPQVDHLILVDASKEALSVAKENLQHLKNVSFMHASVGNLPIENEFLDFAYSLGVLHHVPDTVAAIQSIARKIKPGGYFLVYLYYAFDNRSPAYRWLWKLSDFGRRLICRLPYPIRYAVSQMIAITVYWPLARTAALLERLGILPASWPLAYYRDKPFYVLRTDALDRFGTRLEKRFTKKEIYEMLAQAGFTNIVFSDHPPYWCALATKA